jgi:hypothetical protein
MPRKLLFSVTKKDLKIDTFRSGGPGGQHQNKTETGVRITHPESGAIGISRTERSQSHNKQLAFRSMVASPKFKLWIKIRTAELLGGTSIDDKVDIWMAPENLKIEVQDEFGNWIIE